MMKEIKAPKHNKDWAIPKAEYWTAFAKKNKYCVVIPVINEGEKIRKQLQRIKDNKITDIADVIIADGNSTDGSLEHKFLESVNVRALLIKKDSGKVGAQLRMAYSFALKEGYEGIITVDGNGKDSVESIPLFIEKLEEGYDYVQGSRFVKGGQAINTPLVRHLALTFVHAPVVSICARKRLTDTTNGFRGYSSKYLLDDRVKPFREIFVTYELLAYLSARASRIGLKVCEVPVTRKYPAKGKIPTKISFFKGNSLLLKILWELFTGKYNPKTQE